MKPIILVLAQLATIAGAAHAEDRNFDESVAACIAKVRAADARFAAYIVHDSFPHNHVNYFGTDKARFLFEACMNDYGHPLDPHGHDVLSK